MSSSERGRRARARPRRRSSERTCPDRAVRVIMRSPHQLMILPAAPDVLAAAHRLRGVIQRTPCSYSAPLSARSGRRDLPEVGEPAEHRLVQAARRVQRAAHDAERGAPARRGGVVGGQSWARASPTQRARSACARASSCPSTAPDVKRDGIIAMGAEVDTDACRLRCRACGRVGVRGAGAGDVRESVHGAAVARGSGNGGAGDPRGPAGGAHARRPGRAVAGSLAGSRCSCERWRRTCGSSASRAS